MKLYKNGYKSSGIKKIARSVSALLAHGANGNGQTKLKRLCSHRPVSGFYKEAGNKFFKGNTLFI
ncbi:MAG TPA: hypothetical protein VG847_00745 [Chitinophagaceae bacterium]|nr:hypothetical protein [Chitinophagaceae bacterium]